MSVITDNWEPEMLWARIPTPDRSPGVDPHPPQCQCYGQIRAWGEQRGSEGTPGVDGLSYLGHGPKLSGWSSRIQAQTFRYAILAQCPPISEPPSPGQGVGAGAFWRSVGRLHQHHCVSLLKGAPSWAWNSITESDRPDQEDPHLSVSSQQVSKHNAKMKNTEENLEGEMMRTRVITKGKDERSEGKRKRQKKDIWIHCTLLWISQTRTSAIGRLRKSDMPAQKINRSIWSAHH